jgi:hypothetical protein
VFVFFGSFCRPLQSVGIRDQLGAAVVKGSATKEGQLWMPHEERAFVPAYVKIHSGMVSVYKKDEVRLRACCSETY